MTGPGLPARMIVGLLCDVATAFLGDSANGRCAYPGLGALRAAGTCTRNGVTRPVLRTGPGDRVSSRCSALKGGGGEWLPSAGPCGWGLSLAAEAVIARLPRGVGCEEGCGERLAAIALVLSAGTAVITGCDLRVGPGEAKGSEGCDLAAQPASARLAARLADRTWPEEGMTMPFAVLAVNESGATETGMQPCTTRLGITTGTAGRTGAVASFSTAATTASLFAGSRDEASPVGSSKSLRSLTFRTWAGSSKWSK